MKSCYVPTGSIKILEAKKETNVIVEAQIERTTELQKELERKTKEKMLDIYAKDIKLKGLHQNEIQMTLEMKDEIETLDNIDVLVDDLKESMALINSKNIEKREKSEQFLKRICEKFRQIEEKEKQLNGTTR